MASNGSSFELNGGTLVANLAGMNREMDYAIAAAVSYHSQRALAYARQNAPWTDRTTNARNGLFSRVNRQGAGPLRQYELILGHSVPYGLWLETRWSGRYAIVKPTLNQTGPELMRTLSRAFGEI